MYSVSPEFLTAVVKPDRTLKAKIKIGTYTIYDEDIVDFTVERVLSNDGIPSIGGVVAAKLSLKLLNTVNVPAFYTTQSIKPFVSVTTSVGDEFIPLGVFYPNPDEVVRTDRTIEIECYDRFTLFENLDYSTALTYPIYLFSVLTELETNYGLVITDKGSLPVVTVPVAPSGTVRQVLSDIGELISASAQIGRTGNIEFKFKNTTSFALDGNNYVKFKLLSDTDIDISKIVLQNSSGDVLFEKGTTAGFSLIMENSLITSQAELDAVYNRIYPYSYYAFELDCQGMPHLDVGDTFSLTDINNVVRTLHIVNHTIAYRGGCTSTIQAQAPQSNITSSGSKGANTITQAIKHTITEVSFINNLLAGNITADNIQANAIDASRINTSSLATNAAFVNNLMANEAFIDQLATNQIITETIAGNVASFVEIDASQIISGNISTDRIAAGSIAAGKLAANTITAASGVIADAAITDAKIASLSASKITAGVIDAAAITVVNLNADNITAGTINGEIIGSASVTGDKLASGSVGANTIANNAITTNKIAAGAITASSGIISSLNANVITTGIITGGDGTSWIDVDSGYFNLGNGSVRYSDAGFEINLTGTSVGDTLATQQDSIEEIQSYLHFNVDGLTIGQSSSPMQVSISNEQIDFIESGSIVAYINGQKMYIENAEILNDLIVGKHMISKYSGGNITLIKYVG